MFTVFSWPRSVQGCRAQQHKPDLLAAVTASETVSNTFQYIFLELAINWTGKYGDSCPSSFICHCTNRSRVHVSSRSHRSDSTSACFARYLLANLDDLGCAYRHNSRLSRQLYSIYRTGVYPIFIYI